MRSRCHQDNEVCSPLDLEDSGDLAEVGLITWVMSVRIDSLWEIRNISPSPSPVSLM